MYARFYVRKCVCAQNMLRFMLTPDEVLLPGLAHEPCFPSPHVALGDFCSVTPCASHAPGIKAAAWPLNRSVAFLVGLAFPCIRFGSASQKRGDRLPQCPAVRRCWLALQRAPPTLIILSWLEYHECPAVRCCWSCASHAHYFELIRVSRVSSCEALLIVRLPRSLFWVD